MLNMHARDLNAGTKFLQVRVNGFGSFARGCAQIFMVVLFSVTSLSFKEADMTF